MDTCNGRNFNRRTGLAALALLIAAPLSWAGAPADLAGDWQGKLAVDPANNLTVRFTFTKGSSGAYTAVLNSPDNQAVKDTPVSNVTWDGKSLKFSVPSLSGAYAGSLAGGRITGQWTQPGATLPLELAPWQKPVLSAEAAKAYVGSWQGTLALGGVTQTLVFQFRQGADGLEGTFSIPDQGMTQPMTDVQVENGELSLKALQGRIDFKGRLASNRINGKLKVPSPMAPPDGVDFSLQRGEYQAKPVALKLDAAAFATLKGKWQGTVSITNPQNGQKIELPLTVRFESNDKGEYVGFVDSPAQNVSGIVVTDATLAGGKFTARVGALQAEYAATLSGRKLTGEWSQGGQRLPLELTHAP